MTFLHVAIIFIAGIAGGLYGSTVGGGALVSFPLLILIGMPTPIALGTLRFAAVMLEASSAIRFHKAKKIHLKLAILLGTIGTIGTIAGVIAVIHINPKILNLIIGIILFIVAMVMAYKDRLGIKEHPVTRKQIALLCISMVFVGFYTGFFGPGSGVFNSLLLVFFGFSFLESAAMGRVVGICTSLAGTIIFAQHGLIDYTFGIALGAGFAIGSWIGIGIALKKNDRYIKGLILFVVFLSILKLILNYFNITVV